LTKEKETKKVTLFNTDKNNKKASKKISLSFEDKKNSILILNTKKKTSPKHHYAKL